MCAHTIVKSHFSRIWSLRSLSYLGVIFLAHYGQNIHISILVHVQVAFLPMIHMVKCINNQHEIVVLLHFKRGEMGIEREMKKFGTPDPYSIWVYLSSIQIRTCSPHVCELIHVLDLILLCIEDCWSRFQCHIIYDQINITNTKIWRISQCFIQLNERCAHMKLIPNCLLDFSLWVW